MLARHAAEGCPASSSFRPVLAAALAESDAEQRDRALACLEASPDAAPGLVRALRAELAPEACADALAAPLLESPPEKLASEIESLLFSLVVSGRLARLLEPPPELAPPFSKERFEQFLSTTLEPWVVAQSLAIDQLSLEGSRLRGYARGVAAIAAGNADLRFVDMVRGVPLPEEIRADRELSDAYYGALDQALEPRKARGRDAALVGLRAFAELGSVGDARVDRARSLLSELWSGSRVDALDKLMLPELGPEDFATPERALARALPTFYASRLLSGVDARDPKLLRAFVERGLPKALRDGVDPTKLGAPARTLFAHGFVKSGIRYFRAADFRRAREVLEAGKPDDAGELLLALSTALERGPVDAAELLLKGPGVRGSFDVSALDAVADSKRRHAGMAAFDAAFVLGLAPGRDAPFWNEVAARFDRAAKLLGGGPAAQRDPKTPAYQARQYAEAARATAQALSQNR